MTEPSFLTLAEAVEIHNDQVARYGGQRGIRDLGLLQSALAAPCATFDGQLLHPTLWDMASAYLFHIFRNHPFVDGNKRTALVCALVFLDMNGVPIEDPEGVLYDLTMRVASGKVEKAEIANVLKGLSERPDSVPQ